MADTKQAVILKMTVKDLFKMVTEELDGFGIVVEDEDAVRDRLAHIEDFYASTEPTL